MGIWMKIPGIVMLAVLVCADALAWQCRFEEKLDQVLDVSGSDLLEIAAAAGDLEVTGVAGTDKVTIGGRACASREEWLADIRVVTERGEPARIGVETPELHNGWSIWGNRYAYVDLVLEVPDGLALSLRDSSGDIELENVGAVEVIDSSGDIAVRGARGPVKLKDTSGDIRVEDLGGDLTIVSDSSGDIRGNRIDGSVLVVSDSSGDIRFTGVGRDVVVERDSSGDIVVASVAGDFRVLRDGSGDIRSSDVEGAVSIPRRR